MKKRIKEVPVENKDISIQEHKNGELYAKYKNQHELAWQTDAYNWME